MPLRTAWQWLLLFGVALATRGAFALEPPGRDQGLFWTQADLLLSGARLYDQVWEHKPPGILALYAAARSLSSSYASIHLLNAAAVFASALMLRALCRRRGVSQAGALFGSLLYLLFAAGPAFGGYWMIAQPEVFLDPLLCAALLLSGSAAPGSALLAGIAIGTAVATIKYSALPWVALALLQASGPGAGWRGHLGKLAFAIGCALPPAALIAYFAASGRAQAWLDATLFFNLEHARIATTSFWTDPLTLAFPLLFSLFAFYLFGLGAVADRLLRKRRAATDALLCLGGVLWLLALVQVAIQAKYWTYHYHVMLIPFSILAAVGFDRLRARVTPRLGDRRAAVACWLLALLACGGYFAQIAVYVRQHELIAALRGELSDETFALHYSWGHNDYNFGVDRIVAAQLKKTTRPSDTLFIWGFEPVIYLLAERKPAARFLYDYPLMPHFSRHALYVHQLMDDLHAHPPALFLVLHDDTNDLEQHDSASQLAAIPELSNYLQHNYRQLWSAGKFTCYGDALNNFTNPP